VPRWLRDVRLRFLDGSSSPSLWAPPPELSDPRRAVHIADEHVNGLVEVVSFDAHVGPTKIAWLFSWPRLEGALRDELTSDRLVSVAPVHAGEPFFQVVPPRTPLGGPT
jgi:hypothetical protein